MTAATVDVPPIPELVRLQGRDAAGRLAVRSATEQATYDALSRQSGALSRRLAERGVRPGAPVGVCLPRGPRFAAATLAILRSGGAVLPIDPARTPDGVSAVLRAASARTCLTDRPTRRGSPLPCGTGRATARSTPGGTWMTWVLWLRRLCPLTTADTVLHASGIESPDGMVEMFWPLCCGARVAAVDVSGPLTRLLACQRHRVTVLLIRAAALAEMLAVQRTHSLLPPPWLRLVVCTDGAVPPGLAHRFADQIGRYGCRLHALPPRGMR